jgi:hypothetical protein
MVLMVCSSLGAHYCTTGRGTKYLKGLSYSEQIEISFF